MSRKKTLYFVAGLLILPLYPSFIENELLSLVLIATPLLLILLTKSSVFASKKIIYVALFQFIIFLYLSLSYGELPEINSLGAFEEEYIFKYDLFLTSILCFSIFNIGALYGYNINHPLVNFSILVASFVCAFCFYILIQHGNNAESLELGTLVVVLLPYIFLANEALNYKVKVKCSRIIFFILFLFLLLISNRSALIALIIFYTSLHVHSIVSVSRFMRLFIFILYPTFMFGLIFLYVLGMFQVLEDVSIYFFDKAIDSGRPLIWTELYDKIKQHFVAGMGVNQSSSFLVSSTVPSRNLSSHNTFLELFLRGGVILLASFYYMIFLLYSSYTFRGNENCQYCKLGFASLMSFIFIASFNEVGLTMNIAINCFLWLFFGVSFGFCLKRQPNLNASTVTRSVSMTDH